MEANLHWSPLSDQTLMSKLERQFKKWEGTAYLEGSQAPQAGVDCVRFNMGVLDAMERIPRKKVWIPSDVCYHNPKLAWKAQRALMKRYWPIINITDGEVQPGDMIVSGPVQGGPGHSALIGVHPNTIWQIPGPGTRVGPTGFTQVAPKGYKIFKIMRIKNRSQRWL